MDNYVDWDNEFDSEGLKKDLENVNSNGNTERKEVPHGTYEVKITKLELVKSKKGDPMMTCWFKIVAGEFKNQMLFMNQLLTTGFGLHNANEFLKSIANLPIAFESFKQYAMLLADVMGEIDGNFEYQLNYGKTNKGFNTFKIEKIFDANVPF